MTTTCHESIVSHHDEKYFQGPPVQMVFPKCIYILSPDHRQIVSRHGECISATHCTTEFVQVTKIFCIQTFHFAPYISLQKFLFSPQTRRAKENQYFIRPIEMKSMQRLKLQSCICENKPNYFTSSFIPK